MESIRYKKYAVPEADYSYDRNAVRKPAPKEEPQVVVRPSRRPAEVPSARPRPRHAARRRVSVLYMAVVLAGALFLGSIISMYSQLTEISIASSKLKNEITSLSKQQSALQYQINQKMPLLDIDEYAVNQLGMVKAEESDIIYIENDNTESFEVADRSAVGGVVGYILEKLESCAETVWSFIN